MQSILVVSQNRKSAKEYINKLLSHEKVDTIDINTNSFEKTVGIEDVRNIQKKIFLKPLRSKTKAVVIESYDGITIESQNALLKILEEPPNNTTIIIVSDKIGQILPTILSRCKVVELEGDSVKLSKEEVSLYFNILKSLENAGIGERLKIAQDITKGNANVVPWLEKLAVFVRQRQIKNCNDPKYLNFLREIQKTYSIIKNTNVSHRSTLENLFLNL